jgi:hypothetical protein
MSHPPETSKVGSQRHSRWVIAPSWLSYCIHHVGLVELHIMRLAKSLVLYFLGLPAVLFGSVQWTTVTAV